MSFDNLGSDNVLMEKLKRENPEQFHTLVRMHLSFVLDLHTDDNECVAEKAKFKKWSIFPKKLKNRGIMEGAPLTQEGICQVYQLIEFLSKEPNICQEGIFRRTGSLNRQQELKTLLNSGVTLDLDSGSFSVHDCASVLKGFLAELPEPLLTDVHYPAHCQIAELCGSVGKNKTITNESKLLRALQLLLLLLPPENRVLLKDILELLHLVASYESKNKMSPDSLATLFTPHLLCPRKLSPEDLHLNSQTMSCLVSFMIKKCQKLFDIPPKLATDIRAYFLEREKKKILSPGKDLNESISDRTAANTVYTFIDRERTAQEHISNPTEAALAQLYAHIQSLPESSKKRKLIKQFNKENGHGTPLQFQIRNQKKQSDINRTGKSLGDSIKKHIFQKSITKNLKKNNLLLTPVSTHCLNGTKSSSEEIVNTSDKLNNCITPINSKMIFKPVDETTTESLYKNMIVETSSSTALPTSTPNIDDLDVKPIEISKENLNSKELSISDNRSPPPPPPSPLFDYKTPKFNRGVEHHLNYWKSNNYLTSTPAAAANSGKISKTATSNGGGGCSDGDELFTPQMMIGRKSMSPITRSARRMSKAMQESMMTPRSRKPVLLISGTNICKLASMKKIIQNNIVNRKENMSENTNSSSSSEHSDKFVTLPETTISLEKIDEKHINISNNNNPDENIKVSSLEIVDDYSFEETTKDSSLKIDDVDDDGNKIYQNIEESNCLSSSFRNYLLTRSVITTSPADLSFQSREDDFDSLPTGAAGSEIPDISDSNCKLSDSLLYCLDGNDPNQLELSSPSPSSLSSVNQINRKRNFLDLQQFNEEIINHTPAPKELKLKLRKLSQSGDIVYETSL